MALKFELAITLGNAEMQTFADVAEALIDLAGSFSQHSAGDPYEPIALDESDHETTGNVWDVNGNRVGEWKVS